MLAEDGFPSLPPSAYDPPGVCYHFDQVSLEVPLHLACTPARGANGQSHLIHNTSGNPRPLRGGERLQGGRLIAMGRWRTSVFKTIGGQPDQHQRRAWQYNR